MFIFKNGQKGAPVGLVRSLPGPGFDLVFCTSGFVATLALSPLLLGQCH